MNDLAVTPDGALYTISSNALYSVEAATGKATFVADVPGVDNVGMTFLPDGTLLATDQAGGVRRVDPANGNVTEIGAFGGGYATAGDLVAVLDGTMYAISDMGPVGDEYDNNVLLTVDTATGVAAPVGQIGYGRVFGCAYANGHVFAFTADGNLVEIDRTTGQGTLLRSYPGIAFWGAAVTPLVVVE
jgi:streptogramin lyase